MQPRAIYSRSPSAVVRSPTAVVVYGTSTRTGTRALSASRTMWAPSARHTLAFIVAMTAGTMSSATISTMTAAGVEFTFDQCTE